MTDERDMASLMRSGMSAEARSVQAGPQLSERIIRAAEAATGSQRSAADPTRSGKWATGRLRRGSQHWRPWLMPLVAALGIAVLVGSALVGIRVFGSNGSGQPNVGPAGTATVPAPSHHPSATVSNSPSAAHTSTGSPGNASQPAGPVPAGFHAVDLTWVSVDQGWALGTAPCATAPCTSIVRTDDGGRSWVGIPAPLAELTGPRCADVNCISNLRFANSEVGYAFGPSALYLTVDAGRTWSRQSGGAYGLEIANGSVLRLTDDGLPGGAYHLLRSAVGATSWQASPTPSGGQSSGLKLVRAGHRVVLATFGHTAGGAQNATSVLFASSDDGGHWANLGEPCPQGSAGTAGFEVDTSDVTVAGDGSITVLCTHRPYTAGQQFTMTSTDGGAHFVAGGNLGVKYGTALGAASASVLLVSTDALYRSADGGRTWQPATLDGTDQAAGNRIGPASFIGFETASVGRVLTGLGGTDNGTGAGSASILSTTDAGLHWTAYPFK